MDFSTTPICSFTEAQQQFFSFENTHLAYLKALTSLILRRVGTSWADWDQNPKVGDQKLAKYEGVFRVFGSVFLDEKKSTMQKNRLKIG